MASNFFYLTMSFYYFFVLAMLAIVAPAVFGRRLSHDVKVCVLTTSYPRHPGDVAGGFVAGRGRRSSRAAGVEVTVVSPASFRHFGIAYGDGIANNLRLEPVARAAAAALPASRSRARRAGPPGGADVVHAHWLPSAFAGLATRKPLVRPGVGLGRRAREAPAVALPAAAAPGAGRRLRLVRARRRRAGRSARATCA